MTKILLLHSQYSIIPPVKCSNIVNSVSTQTIKKLGINPTPTNLVDYAKALVSNPLTQTKKPAPVQLHHPSVAPPLLPLPLLQTTMCRRNQHHASNHFPQNSNLSNIGCGTLPGLLQGTTHQRGAQQDPHHHRRQHYCIPWQYRH